MLEAVEPEKVPLQLPPRECASSSTTTELDTISPTIVRRRKARRRVRSAAITSKSAAACDGAKTSAETIAAPIQVTAVKSSSQCASSEINPAASGKPWVGGPCDTPLRDGSRTPFFHKEEIRAAQDVAVLGGD